MTLSGSNHGRTKTIKGTDENGMVSRVVLRADGGVDGHAWTPAGEYVGFHISNDKQAFVDTDPERIRGWEKVLKKVNRLQRRSR